MRFLKPLLIAALLFLPSLILPPFIVPIALIKMQLTKEWPEWAWWLETPDQMLPGDLTIPTVKSVYDRFGWFVCSWYWLGVRNTAQGWAASYGVPVTQPWSPEPGYYENGLLWWLRKPFTLFGFPLQLKAGWRTYAIKGQWTAVPCLTITRP